MFPYKTSITFDRKSNQPLYLQLSNQLIALINANRLPSKTKLPGSRTLAALLEVHRKTIVACYDELLLQGWIETIPQRGTFVHSDLPELQQQDFSEDSIIKDKNTTGFQFYKRDHLQKNTAIVSTGFITLNDGVSDARLTPINDIARIYRRITSKKNASEHLSYGSVYGNETLRVILASYLSQTRGLDISKEQILITRGSQNGIYLASQLLFKKGDCVLVGDTNYASADTTFKNQEAKLIRVDVDVFGLNTNQIEEICQKQNIKGVYVTSHHHHPTTVTLSAERRIHLLNLAQKYNFAIIEDDYDYDFNYNHSPILPLASHDVNGNVIYIGSVCKTVAPVFRVGYLVAPKAFVDEAAAYRKIVDRQGDALLELTFASFIKSGDLDRHIKKVLKIYKVRRDLMCSLLTEKLAAYFEFEIPKGGMAIWLSLTKKLTWKRVAEAALLQQLEIGDWTRYDPENLGHNAIRLGFASYNEAEIYQLIEKFELTFKAIEEEKSS
ncbi:GntR family transcriptional regulator [Polaribacter pacificus]|uniref:GntR family transcriptional regulator n=1 Tax=Polaribacter pacificus TaxID=1775173 RepID=A0A917MAK8_9FLAO|nr:PLP-dependent aminotransferase family protein [Polaribacter pacificus]GGG88066.1 GntR family transcriptional regulator [Polaribacter pacificus]